MFFAGIVGLQPRPQIIEGIRRLEPELGLIPRTGIPDFHKQQTVFLPGCIDAYLDGQIVLFPAVNDGIVYQWLQEDPRDGKFPRFFVDMTLEVQALFVSELLDGQKAVNGLPFLPQGN